jgi:glycopeptide antibiotics resistance protein
MIDSRPVPGSPPTSSTPLRGRHLFALAAAYGLIATYGSLVPLDFQPMPLGHVARRVEEVFHQRLDFRSRSDLFVNVALAIPLSFLLMAGVCADRSRTVVLLAAPGVVLACVVFAAGIEFLQLFFPPRVSSLTDVVSQGLGSCVGALSWALCGQRIVDGCRRLAKIGIGPGTAGLLWPGYMVVLILTHMAPFDLITRPGEAAAKWREGRIHVVPFQTCCKNPIQGWDNMLIDFAYFLPLGLLWGLGPVRQNRGKVQLLHTAAIGLLAAGAVETLQLMVFSRSCDTTDILTGLLATIAGAEAVTVFCRPHDRAATFRSQVFLGLAIFAWLAALVNDYWRPFAFSGDFSLVASRLHRIEWLPLADLHHGDDFQAILHVFDRVLLFLVLGALCTLGFRHGWRRAVRARVVAAVFAVALVLETGQLFLASRYFGVTDILFAVLGGWLGYSLVAVLTKLADLPRAA